MSPAVANKPVLNNRRHTGPRLPWTGPASTCCWASDTRTAMDLALRSSGLGNYQLCAAGTPTSRDGDEDGETVLNGSDVANGWT